LLDFIGIGGQRCGTTWLYANLNRHPAVRFPAGKEVHYWDSRADEGRRPWLRMFPAAPPGVMQGDITPSYAILPARVVAKVAKAVPDARLVLNIRNPIQRSWSASLLFLKRCQMGPDEASDAWFVDVARSRRCEAKGTFSTTIETWREAFSDEQLLLVLYDDLCREPAAVMRKVAVHLGIDPQFYEDDSAEVAESRGIATSATMAPPTTVLDLCRALYAEEIARLETILGRDLGHWSAWEGT
jgi:hypothetical protein